MTRWQSLVYVYGIVPSGGDLDLFDGPTVIAGARFGPPRLLSSDGFAAVVSDLSLRGGASLDARLENDREAEGLVLQHHRVLQALIDRQSVLPFRFGVMFNDDQGLADALSRHGEMLRDALEGVDGAVEWGLKVYCEHRRLGSRLAAEIPAIVELEGKIATAEAGKAFFLRRGRKRLIEEETEQAIARCLGYTGERLGSAVRVFASGKPQPPEVHGRESEMVFNGACLVDRGAKRAFFELIEDLRDVYAGFGFEHEITGPWPPYSFADCRLGGDEHAA